MAPSRIPPEGGTAVRARRPRPTAAPGTARAGSVIIPAASREVRTSGKNKRERPVTAALARQNQALAKINAGLTAAAMLMDGTTANRSAMAPNAQTRTWQHAAWGYTRSCGELNAAMMFYGNCFAQISLKVGKRSPDGTVDQTFDAEAPEKLEGVDPDIAKAASDIVGSMRTKLGGQDEFMRSTGEKLFVCGELYWVPEDDPSGMVFEVLSTQELLPEGDSFTRFYGPGWAEEPLDPDIIPIRVWRPDPQYGRLATSSVRSVLEILEELVVLTRQVRAAAISRMALAGILAISEDFDAPLDDSAEDGDEAESMNPLATDIINTGSKAIDDPASAAAFMPYILQGPTDLIDRGIKHIPFQGDSQESVIKRQEALQRLAQGLDCPVEIILGHMNTTFANARQISEDTFRLYLEPAVRLVCDSATVSILWPALAIKQGLAAERTKDSGYPPEIMAVAVTYDATKLISRPDRSKDIVELITKDATQMFVGIAEGREAVGLDPDKQPDDEEVAKRLDAYRLSRIRETIAAPASDAAVPLDAAGKAVVPGESEGSKLIGQVAEGTAPAGTLPGAAQSAEANPTPAGPAAAAPATAAPTAQQQQMAHLAHRIAGAAELTIERAAERIGAKLRAQAKGAVADRIESVPNADCAMALGRDAVTALLAEARSSVDKVIGPEFAGLTRSVTRWAAEAGHPEPAKVAQLALEFVTAMAGDRLYGGARVVTYELTAPLVQLGR